MLDINYIRDNADKIKEAIKQKRIDLDLERLLEADSVRRALQNEADELRKQRNSLAQDVKGGRPTEDQVRAGRELKEKLSALEQRLSAAEDEYLDLMVKVPTIPSPEVPIGKDDSENVEIYRNREPGKFDFEPKSYIELALMHDLIDFDRGAKVAGYRGYYLKNEAVTLVMGIMMHAVARLVEKGFTPMIPPTLVREFALFGSGYFSGRTYDPERDEIYKIANDEKLSDGTVQKEGKFLVGTAEPSLLAYFANEVLDSAQLPMKLCGFSQCYRSEIGSYGKDAKGIYRVHEFMKVEQVCIAPADIALSDSLHQEMVSISKELHEDLELPYRQLAICTGDMSAGKYRMFDLEAWIPSRGGYGETGSASNFLDWQARRLNVKYKDSDGSKKYVFMLNNTALASARTLIALLENHQEQDGSIRIPEVLRRYMPGGKQYIGR